VRASRQLQKVEYSIACSTPNSQHRPPPPNMDTFKSVLCGDNGIGAYATTQADKLLALDSKTTETFHITIRWTPSGIIYANKAGDEVKGPQCTFKELYDMMGYLGETNPLVVRNKWSMYCYAVPDDETGLFKANFSCCR
jgi:hypothetical protein